MGERERSLARTSALACALAVSGCDPMPDASAAQRAFHAHRASIAAVDEGLRAMVRALPPEVRCPDAASVVARHDPAADRAFEECTARRSAWLTAHTRATEALRRETLPDLLDAHPSVLGIELALATPYAVGNLHPSNPGTAAGEGTTLEGFDVGWHLYQTAFAYVPSGRTEYVHAGDAETRPGIEVAWALTEGERTARARAALLIEGQTDAAWRTAHRAAVR